MIERIQLRDGHGYEWLGDPERTAVVLPGAMFGGAPSCYYAALTLFEAGWRVVQVWDEYDGRTERTAWARGRAEAALDHAGETQLLVAKSATTLAAPVAAERSLAAIWLTPLLEEEPCAAGLRARTAPALLVGGTEDESWDGALARELGDEIVELEGAEHSLAKLEHLPMVIDAVAAFAARI